MHMHGHHRKVLSQKSTGLQFIIYSKPISVFAKSVCALTAMLKQVLIVISLCAPLTFLQLVEVAALHSTWTVICEHQPLLLCYICIYSATMCDVNYVCFLE